MFRDSSFSQKANLTGDSGGITSKTPLQNFLVSKQFKKISKLKNLISILNNNSIIIIINYFFNLLYRRSSSNSLNKKKNTSIEHKYKNSKSSRNSKILF